ncbi:MAG: polyphosphate polymerase domain-containing protein [Lutisporaceae bacterium]
MSKFQGTFKRYEKKYLLSEKKYKMLRQKLQDILIIDNFRKTTICNIYFDTPDHLLIRTSLEKPIYKEKLRLRSYGTPLDGDMVFVELKKKYKGIVYKRRVKMELSMAESYLYDLEPVSQPSQITREIDWFLNFYKDIAPAMHISYNRIAAYGVEDPELRVTFDSNILWREDKLWLGAGVSGNQLLEEGQRLMEIKIPGNMPLWLSHILDELEIYPTSFSKYGNAYQTSEQLKKNERKKGEIRYA